MLCALKNRLLYLIIFSLFIIPNVHADSIDYYNNLAKKYYNEGFFYDAEKYYEKCLKIVDTNSIKDYIEKLYNLGTVKINIFKFNESLNLFDKVLKIMQNHEGIAQEIKIRTISNIGFIYMTKGEYQLAISYYEIVLSEINIQSNMNGTFVRMIDEIDNHNVGYSFYKLENYNKAIPYFLKSLKYIQNQRRTDSIYALLMLENIYFELGNIEKSKLLFKKIFNIAKEANYEHQHMPEVFFDYYLLMKSEGNIQEAIKSLELSLKYSLRYYIKNSNKVAKVYMGYGDIYTKISNYNLALQYYQKAIHCLVPEFNDTLTYNNPDITNVEDNLLYIDILKNKAYALGRMGEVHNEISFFDLSLSTYKYCTKVLDYVKLSYQTSSSKLFMAKKEKGTYVQAMNEVYLCYKNTSDPKYLNDIFFYSEKIKSSVLLSSIRENEAMQIGGISPDLLLKEDELKRQIVFYEEQIYNSEIGDSVQVREWKNIIFNLKKDYEDLKKQFEKNYPDYYNLKYNTQIAGLNFVQSKLTNDQILIEYALYDTVLYICTVSHKNVTVKQVNIDSSFYNTINDFTGKLTNNETFNYWDNNSIESFYICSGKLYNYLIKPVNELIQNKRLLIIPDEKIAGIPFEVLCKNNTGSDNHNVSYKDLPYLINTNPVYYAYSSTLLFSDQKNLLNNNKVLCIAPEYKNKYHFYDPDLSVRRQFDTLLIPLPGSEFEIEKIKDVLKTESLTGNSATETNFKKLAGNYKILHLAAHTFIDNNKPLYSKIIFTSDSSQEDGLLNTFELYNLKLNAELTFLSSCKSGNGVIQEGEGIMSMARGFTYAGCKSIAFSMWDLNDMSTSEVVADFYKYLSKGYTKDKALQKAKLDYIKNADQIHMHPWFWSGIVITGNPEALYVNKFKIILYTLIILIAVAVIATLYIRLERRPKLINKN